MQPGTAIGRYRLEHRLGQGGMKEVWSGREDGSGRAVAVAVLHRFEPSTLVNEVLLARRVVSPHVAAVLDGFVSEDGRGVVVSELCEGPDLARVLTTRAPAPGAALAMAAQMACGLAAIHAAHVLHRDVKPGNAMLTAAGVKVIDFGISLPALDHRTGVGDDAPPAGTLPFMAPECFGGGVDARTDVYALGVSVHELVSGRLPARVTDLHAWIGRLLAGEPLPADALAGYDPRVAALFTWLCHPDRERRPFMPEAADALAALAPALGGAVLGGAIAPPLGGAFVDGAPTERAPAAGMAVRGAAASPTIRHLPVALPSPDLVVVGWPHAPLLALVPAGGRTLIRGLDGDGRTRFTAEVADELRGGLVADLDGDGVGELYAWSRGRVHALDAAGRTRWSVDVTPRPGPWPWDAGDPAPVVLDGPGGRELAVGAVAIDPVARAVHALPGGWQGQGDELVDARGVAGLSCHGAARQRFRGDLATPAAILARRGQPGFVVAALERVFDGRPTVALGLWGPGGRRIGGGVVGRYALETAPLEVYAGAQRIETALFDPRVAPLAVLGGEPADDVIVVPFFESAPWFGPVIVAFDRTGHERWRERLAPGARPAPPLLVDLDGAGQACVVWGDGAGQVQVRDARSGAPRPALAGAGGAPVAALDLGGTGAVHLVGWSPDGLTVTRHGPCLPGAVLWLPSAATCGARRTLGVDGLPDLGPRA
ncbi:MAG: serine/threonine protein kinase [Kofleriaceae bacterium]|nr:serine/threonine protein kinase [Kofleriaceae bacterium]